MVLHSNYSVLEYQAVSPILSERFLFYVINIFFVGINEAVAFFGIIFNVINMAVFWRQGFAEVINISLFALAFSDFGMVTMAFAQGVFLNLWNNFDIEHINFNHFQYFFVAFPKTMFARTGGMLTAFICFERCVCVILPLKVKSILTRRVSVMVVVCIFITLMGTCTMHFISTGFAPQYSATLNTTVLSLFYRNGEASQDLEENILLVMSSYQLISFFLVVLFTCMLVFKMQQKNKWREKTVSRGQMETMATRDNKVIKMVIVICTNFIICFTPAVAQLSSPYIVANYSIRGPYRRLYLSVWSVCGLAEIICCSSNIIFYYRMSSKYAGILQDMLPCLLARKSKPETGNL